jgi:hypothetical protein
MKMTCLVLLHRAVWQKSTDVSEIPAASMIGLMQATSTSHTSVNFYHTVTTQDI